MYSGQRTDDVEDVQAASAVAEAHRRWGSRGSISLADNYRNARCLVGELEGGRFWIRGRGATWEAAFTDCEARDVGATRRHADR